MGTEERASAAELALWRRLVAAGFRAGARYEDAQDLASQALLRALEAYDATRGAFEPFCRTIHANLVKNHWRDRKPTREFDPEADGGTDGFDPHEWLVLWEDREMLRDIADRILATLAPEEAAFFLALADAYREAESAAVTVVARRLGHEPLHGWDIFRRIQRKARPHLAEFRESPARPARRVDLERAEVPAADAAPMSAPPRIEPLRAPKEGEEFAQALSAIPRAAAAGPRPDPLLLLASLCATAGHERFAAALSGEQRSRLAALLS